MKKILGALALLTIADSVFAFQLMLCRKNSSYPGMPLELLTQGLFLSSNPAECNQMQRHPMTSLVSTINIPLEALQPKIDQTEQKLAQMNTAHTAQILKLQAENKAFTHSILDAIDKLDQRLLSDVAMEHLTTSIRNELDQKYQADIVALKEQIAELQLKVKP